MSRTSKKPKTEAHKNGDKRMDKFEKRSEIKELPIIQSVNLTDDEEEYTITAYQKIPPNEWQKVELTYKRKRR